MYPETKHIFLTGATGYIGRALMPELIARGHRVRALARPESAKRVPSGVEVVIGDALHAESFASQLKVGDTLVHLVGTPHPSPAKAQQFVDVDLASIRASVAAATQAGCAHVVYVSVAQPAPVMQSYIDVRKQGERAIAEAGLTATVLRPWYVLGPTHRWPTVLLPLYAIGKRIPSLRDSCMRLDLIPLGTFVRAIVWSAEHPPTAGTVRILDAPAIKGLAKEELGIPATPHARA